MSKLTKQLEYQQKVNQEAQKLMKHFGEEVDLKCYYMRMAKTQAQVISLMRVYETNDDPEGEEILVPKDVSLFFMDCCDLFGLLEPLDKLATEAETGLSRLTTNSASTRPWMGCSTTSVTRWGCKPTIRKWPRHRHRSCRCSVSMRKPTPATATRNFCTPRTLPCSSVTSATCLTC